MIVTLRVPGPRFGQSAIIEIDALTGSPVCLDERGYDQGEISPVPKKSPFGEKSTGGPGKRAPLSPKEWGYSGECAPFPAPPVLAALTGSDVVDLSPEGVTSANPRTRTTDDIRDDIREAREAMAEKSREIAELDRRLTPGRAEADDIKNATLATHRHEYLDRDRRVIVLDFAGVPDRKALFARLDANAAKWGPMREQRKLIQREVNDLDRLIQRLEKDLARQSKRKRSA